MYDNVGSRLKGLAMVLCWIGIIASAITAIVFWAAGQNFFIGLLYLVLGALGSWIGSWVMYAIGDIHEKTEHIAYELDNLKKTGIAPAAKDVSPLSAPARPRVSPAYVTQPAATAAPKKKCPHCGANNNMTNTTCFACGEKLE